MALFGLGLNGGETGETGEIGEAGENNVSFGINSVHPIESETVIIRTVSLSIVSNSCDCITYVKLFNMTIKSILPGMLKLFFTYYRSLFFVIASLRKAEHCLIINTNVKS